MTKLDRICLFGSLAVLLYIAGAYISNSYAIGAVYALSGVLLALTFANVLPKHTKTPHYALFVRHMLLEGKGVSNRYLYLLLPPRDLPEGDEYAASDGSMVVNALGYGKLNEEAAAKLYRKWKHDKPRRLVVAATEVDRNAAVILSLCADEVQIWKPPRLYRRLKKGGHLADLPPIAMRRGRLWLKSFRPKHAALLAVNAVANLLLSLWLPFKTYYYFFAVVSAVAAIAILLYNRFAE